MGGRLSGAGRANVLDSATLSDGRNAWAVAEEMGMNEATFRARLNKFWGDADRALADPFVAARRISEAEKAERRAINRELYLDGLAVDYYGRPAWPIARANGIPGEVYEKRIKRGWSGERAAKQSVTAVGGDPNGALLDGRKAWPIARQLGMRWPEFVGRVNYHRSLDLAVYEVWKPAFRVAREADVKRRAALQREKFLEGLGLVHGGEMPWARAVELGIPGCVYATRIKLGWEPEKAATLRPSSRELDLVADGDRVVDGILEWWRSKLRAETKKRSKSADEEGLDAFDTRDRKNFDEVLLKNGSLAWPKAEQMGIGKALFIWRLGHGWSPDLAATKPLPKKELKRRAAERAAPRDVGGDVAEGSGNG